MPRQQDEHRSSYNAGDSQANYQPLQSAHWSPDDETNYQTVEKNMAKDQAIQKLLERLSDGALTEKHTTDQLTNKWKTLFLNQDQRDELLELHESQTPLNGMQLQRYQELLIDSATAINTWAINKSLKEDFDNTHIGEGQLGQLSNHLFQQVNHMVDDKRVRYSHNPDLDYQTATPEQRMNNETALFHSRLTEGALTNLDVQRYARESVLYTGQDKLDQFISLSYQDKPSAVKRKRNFMK